MTTPAGTFLWRSNQSQGTLRYFDLDYHGSPPSYDGNDQSLVMTTNGTALTMFFYYEEGNSGNNYIVRVYPEWDKDNFILNSDNNESCEEVGQEVGGFRWDMETYTVPSVPRTYRIRVVYRAISTPPTWSNYDRLLAEGIVIVSACSARYPRRSEFQSRKLTVPCSS
jgi:hypothetical protein